MSLGKVSFCDTVFNTHSISPCQRHSFPSSGGDFNGHKVKFWHMADLTSFTSSLFRGDGGGEREKPRQWGWEVAMEYRGSCVWISLHGGGG